MILRLTRRSCPVGLCSSSCRYVYVENLTWVILLPNNKVAQLSADYLGRSHRTLLIFRRDMKEHPQGRAIELRHQRSPDVDISIGRTGAGAHQGSGFHSALFLSSLAEIPFLVWRVLVLMTVRAFSFALTTPAQTAG